MMDRLHIGLIGLALIFVAYVSGHGRGYKDGIEAEKTAIQREEVVATRVELENKPLSTSNPRP